MFRSCLTCLSIVIGIPLAVLMAYFGLNYSGFCFDKIRYLSDEEKIKAVFNYQNNRTRLPVKTIDRGIQFYSHIKYESFEQYIQANPDCCAINPGDGYDLPPSSFWNRISGYDSGDIIVVNFKMRYLDDKGNRKIEKIRFEHFITNCGKPH